MNRRFKGLSRTKAIAGEVRMVMEATGAYHLSLLSGFKGVSLFMSVINPLDMKKHALTDR